MVSGKDKSKSRKRVYKRTPGGKTVIHRVREAPQRASCSGCGKKLAGVPNRIPSQLKKLPKTQRRPQRPYGGVLCSACSRAKIKANIKE